ncbi:hypothetical protein ACHWQZ_G008506 [Mnemiopsis leidyi]
MSSPLGSPGGSPFGERKSYKNFERRMSSRFSRQESSTSNSDGEDFRAMARRLSKSSAASSQLIDPAARLAAQKKLEADEKLRLQKEIEAMKDKMNNVETVEKTGFKYDPSKVRGQIEIEIKEAEDAVFEGPEEDNNQEYKEWLEEMMAHGWNDEVKELVSGRKKVTKANLLRARKRSIVRRYSVIVPGVRDEYQVTSEEDEYTEEEKLRREVERRFETEVDLNYTIDQLSNDKSWMAEIQELVGAKKKINHHNLCNARKRNIVKNSEQRYPGCTYELSLEPDELTDVELKRRELDENIEVIRIIVGGTDDVEVIIDSLSKKWIFNLDDLDKQKKKRNKNNIFNHLVRQLIREAKDKFPDLDYHVDLEDDEYTDEEQRRRDFESAARKIDAEVGAMSIKGLVEMYPDLAPRLDEKNRVISMDNGVRLLKRDALIRIYGEGDNYMLKYHELSDDCFDLNDRGLALQYINSQMEKVDEKLKDKDNFSSIFQDELAYFTSIMAHTSPENVWQFCLNRIKTEAIKLFPDCGIEMPIPEYDMTAEGKAFVKLMADFSELDTLLASVPEEILMTESAWVRQRAFLESQRTKVCGKNIITVQKQKLYDEFKRNFPDFDYEEIFPFEEYTYGEMAVMKAQEKQARYNVICEKLEQELTNAKISLDRAHKRSELEGDRLDNHLEESEWKEELGQIKLIDNLAVNRKNLFEFKARNLVAMYRKMYQEFDFAEYDEIRHEYETEDEGFITAVGCLTCEIKSRTAFFDSNSEGHSPLKYLSAEGDPQDQIIVAIPYFSDTDTSGPSVPPSPYEPRKSSFSDLIEEENSASENRINELPETPPKIRVSDQQNLDVPGRYDGELSEENHDSISELERLDVDMSEQQKIDLSEQQKIDLSEQQMIDLSAQQKIDLSEQQKIDLSEQQTIDLSEQQKTEMSEQQEIDLSEQQTMDLSEQQNMDLSEQQKIDLSDQQKMNLSDQQKMDLSEQQKIDLSEQQKIDLSEQQKIDLSEQQKIDLSEQQKVDSAEEIDSAEQQKQVLSSQQTEEVSEQQTGDISYSPPSLDSDKIQSVEQADKQPNSATKHPDSLKEAEVVLRDDNPTDLSNISSNSETRDSIDKELASKPQNQKMDGNNFLPETVEDSSKVPCKKDIIGDCEISQILTNTEEGSKAVKDVHLANQQNNNGVSSDCQQNTSGCTEGHHQTEGRVKTGTQINEIQQNGKNSESREGNNINTNCVPANEIESSCNDANNKDQKVDGQGPLDANLTDQPKDDHDNTSCERIMSNTEQPKNCITSDEDVGKNEDSSSSAFVTQNDVKNCDRRSLEETSNYQGNIILTDKTSDISKDEINDVDRNSNKHDNHTLNEDKDVISSHTNLVQKSPVSKSSFTQNVLEKLEDKVDTDFNLTEDLSREEIENDSSEIRDNGEILDSVDYKPTDSEIETGRISADQVPNSVVGCPKVEIQIEETEEDEATKKHIGNDDADKLDFRISEPSRSFIEGPDDFLDTVPSEAESIFNEGSVFGKDLDTDQILSESENIGQSAASHEIVTDVREQPEQEKTFADITTKDEPPDAIPQGKNTIQQGVKEGNIVSDTTIAENNLESNIKLETDSRDYAPEEQHYKTDATAGGVSDRPAVLLTQGFDFDTVEITDDLESCTLPAGLMLTPGEPMNSPFPSHGYVSPHKTFESRDRRENSASPLCNGTTVRDSAYESKSSMKSEDELLHPSEPVSPGVNLGIHLQPPDSDGTELGNRGSEGDETEHTESGMMVPAALKSESFGSDSVFLNSSPSPQLLETADELSETALYSGADDSEVTPACSGPDEKDDVEFSGNDGDTEYSPADESLLNKTSNDPPKQLTLPGRTISQMRKVSSTSESSEDETDEKKSNRSPKRKKMSGSGSVTPEQHPLLKRQEEYNKRTSILEARKISTFGRQSLNSDDTPTGCAKDQDDTTPTKPTASFRPSSLPLRKPVNKSTEGSVTPNFDHIQSSYKPEKPNPLYDRTKYIKVPTLEDKNVAAEPILDGLLPKEFYDQKLSYDLSAHSTPKVPKKPRDKSEFNAPTTGHMLWELMKERRLERAEEDNIITDLDLAVS